MPTHPDGVCIFWEFATDSYDIGFGLIFEWTSNPGEHVSVHVSESEDTDEDEDEDQPPSDAVAGGDDPEKALQLASDKSRDANSATSVIIPIYRRDCHEEVIESLITSPSANQNA